MKKPATSGTARAAFQSRDYRTMWTANFASTIGSWMQNVVLPIYIYSNHNSASLVGIFVFAQLGPQLLLAIPGGVIADRFDLRRWLAFCQALQLSFSIGLGLATQFHGPLLLLFLMQLGVGIGQALHGPASAALLPSLVPPQDLPGAIALNSVVVNGSRVSGPIIVAFLTQFGVTTAQVFYINAVTYLAVIVALYKVTMPHHGKPHERGLESFLLGIRYARDNSTVGKILVSMASFSFLSLPFVGLFPAVARLNLHINEKTPTYKWLYATWGIGAMLGALAVGTVFAQHDKRIVVRQTFFFFAVSMCAFTVAPNRAMAFFVVFFLGAAYFATTTSLMTVLQARLDPTIRARVLALWFMAFGGTIPLGNMAFGPVMDSLGPRPVLFLGAAWALFLSWWCNIKKADDAVGYAAMI